MAPGEAGSITHARKVFVTGASGYVGRPLLAALQVRGHAPRALVRPASARGLPQGVERVIGDALMSCSFRDAIAPCDTLVQLVGTPHPSPRKAAEFERVDRASALASIEAALAADVRHFVYVSVAQPAPVMRSYIAIRAGIEARLREAHAQAGLRVSILRPWYVLGPGHRWPYALLPFYAMARALAPMRDTAQRLGLVTLREMVAVLVYAIEHPPRDVAVIDVPAIRTLARCVDVDAPLPATDEHRHVWP